jgi:hypothetical protein
MSLIVTGYLKTAELLILGDCVAENRGAYQTPPDKATLDCQATSAGQHAISPQGLHV